jgi:hypothetical protein
MRGSYLSLSDIAGFSLNETASSWLYTESIVHFAYVLSMLFKRAYAEKPWATPAFFIQHLGLGLSDIEAEDALTPGSLLGFILPRLAEMDSLTGDERQGGEHFRQSAARVCERDSSADEEAVMSALDRATYSYFDDARKQFGL